MTAIDYHRRGGWPKYPHRRVHPSTRKEATLSHEECSDDVEAFLATGKSIQEIPSGESGLLPDGHMKGGSPIVRSMRKINARRGRGGAR